MFKTVKFLEKTKDPFDATYSLLLFEVHDTNFVEPLSLRIRHEWLLSEDITYGNLLPSGLISFYLDKGDLITNIAQYYHNTTVRAFSDLLEFISYDKYLTDKFFPTIEYGKKYYQCVVSRVKRLRFSNKRKYANEKPLPGTILFED